MRALLVLSVVLVAIVTPVLVSKYSDPRRGIRNLLITICIYNALYLIYLTMIHPNVFIPHWP